jgi:tetratricopeptide (TPR) repeat protein
VSLLNDADATVRSRGNWGFGYLGRSEAIQFLQNSLNDESAIVRRAAVENLGRLGNSSVVPALLSMLGDYDSSVRDWAAWALGQIGDSLAAHPLIALLNDDNKNVRKSAATALGRLNERFATESLLLALSDTSKEVRRSVAIAISKLGDPIAIPHLNRGFESVRFRAMARMKVQDVVPRIMFVSSYGDEASAKDNSFSLIHLDPSAAITVLEQCRRRFSKKSWVHNSRGQALWKLGNMVATKESFHKALELDSEDITSLLALVHYYLELGELQEAMDYARNAVLYSPYSSICLLTYAVTLWLQGEAERAWAHLKRAKLQNRHITDIADLQFEYFWREKALSALKELLTYKSMRA